MTLIADSDSKVPGWYGPEGKPAPLRTYKVLLSAIVYVEVEAEGRDQFEAAAVARGIVTGAYPNPPTPPDLPKHYSNWCVDTTEEIIDEEEEEAA